MKKIYDDAKDKNVASVVVYGDSTDGKLYETATGLEKAQAAISEVKELFEKKKLIIDVDGDLCEPLSVVGTKVMTVNVGSSVDILTEWTAKSDS